MINKDNLNKLSIIMIEKAPGAKPRAVELVELVAVLICPDLRAAQTGRLRRSGNLSI